MPRGVRKPKEVKSFDEQITDIDAQIANLKEQKKELIKNKEQADINYLLEAAKAAGKTPAELVAELTKSTVE